MIIYLLSAITAAALLFFHLLGNDGLYFTYPRYDIFMHIMGGVTIGFLAYQLSLSAKNVLNFSWKNVVYAVFLIGLAWEIFEAMFNIAGAPVGTKAYYIDTIKDLVDDCIGALLAVYVSSVIEKIRSKKTVPIEINNE